MNDFVRFAMVCFCACLIAPTSAGADRATPLTVHSDGEHVWVYRSVPSGDGDAMQVVFAFGQDTETGLRFRQFRNESPFASVAAAAIRGENLHVFLRDGSHYRLRHLPRDLATPRFDMDTNELTAPGRSVPMAVCGDSDADAIFAIVTTKAASPLPLHVQPTTDQEDPAPSEGDGKAQHGGETEERSDADDWDDKPALITAESLVSKTSPTPRFSLVRYFRGKWEFVSLCPTAMDDASNFRLACNEGSCAVLYSEKSAPKQTMFLTQSKDGWQTPTKAPDISDDDFLAFVSHNDAFTLIARRPKGATASQEIVAYTLLDSVWKSGEPFDLTEEDSTGSPPQVAAGSFGENLLVAYQKTVEDDTQVWVGQWPPNGGAAKVEPGQVAAMASDRSASETSRVASIVMAVAITSMLFVVFLRRSPSLFTDLETPKGYVLAGFGKRLLAFLIDLVAVSLVAGPVFIAPWFAENVEAGSNMQRELTYLLERDPNAAFLPWIQSLLLFVVYTIVMEAAFKATLGKTALGLRVCGTQGSNCTLRAIVTRNCLRVELYYMLAFLPLAMLILLTRNNQRLGDLIAGTLVVEKKRTLPTETKRSEEPDDSERTQ
ncbi:MAG: RDD family protein [Planctomycetes bacterium]|nr:RDD family protein [Planctomycetota bacterium]